MNTSTPLDLDAIRAYCETATEAPWNVRQYPGHAKYPRRQCSIFVPAPNGLTVKALVIAADAHAPNDHLEALWIQARFEDMEFISCARTDLPRCLAVIDALREALVEAEIALSSFAAFGKPSILQNSPYSVLSQINAALALVQGGPDA